MNLTVINMKPMNLFKQSKKFKKKNYQNLEI